MLSLKNNKIKPNKTYNPSNKDFLHSHPKNLKKQESEGDDQICTYFFLEAQVGSVEKTYCTCS